MQTAVPSRESNEPSQIETEPILRVFQITQFSISSLYNEISSNNLWYFHLKSFYIYMFNIPSDFANSVIYSSGHHRSLLRAIGRRYFARSAEELAKRNYANNESEYNTVIASLTAQRRFRPFLSPPGNSRMFM